MEALKIVVIGGVAAGASFAARARRLSESADITLIERGPDVSFANCGIPYHIGGEIPDRRALSVQTAASLKALLNLDVLTLTEAVSIDRSGKRVRIRDLDTLAETWLPYDRLMLAPGATPVRPALPGIDDPRIFTLRNLQDMDRIMSAAKAGRRAVIVGAGFIGLEMAEQLQRRGLSVEIVELEPQVLPQLDMKLAALLHQVLAKHEVGLHLGQAVVRFASMQDELSCHLTSGAALRADMVLMSTGVQPESSLAQAAGLSLGNKGHVIVNAFMQTSDPDIYAAGDVVETREKVLGGQTALPLGGPANRQGRVAADHIFLRQQARPYPGSLGTAIVRVFDLAAGTTGVNEAALKAKGIDYESITVSDNHHASYYPGAMRLTVKIFWEKGSGRLLGAQAVGQAGVDKRLDVLATAITAKMTIYDLCHLELAYAPPFGSAKDVINLAGFAATNMEDGLVEIMDTFPETGEGVQLLDVRGRAFTHMHPVASDSHIPLADLRENFDRLDRNRPVVTFCMVGKSSYFAARLLAQHGFDVKSVAGGVTIHPDRLREP